MLQPRQPTAKAGGGQANKQVDVKTVRSAVNNMIRLDLIPGWHTCLQDTDSWDDPLRKAVKAIENTYFFGMADPNGKIEENDTLFSFLIHAEASYKALSGTLSPELYSLAAVMVPGGSDHTHKTVHMVPPDAPGHKARKEIHLEILKGNIRHYLPNIMQALEDDGLNDTDMVMMALGTIRAETAAFKPISEGISKWNTTPASQVRRDKEYAPFDKYENAKRLGNNQSGDGERFKGRGFVQLTGRFRYQEVGDQIGVDLVGHPELANDEIIASQILAQYLKNHESSIRKYLLNNNLAAARRSVNGGSHGLNEFKAAFKAGRRNLGIVVVNKAKVKTVRKTLQ